VAQNFNGGIKKIQGILQNDSKIKDEIFKPSDRFTKFMEKSKDTLEKNELKKQEILDNFNNKINNS